MDFPFERISRSESETELIAKDFSAFVTEGMIIVLIGDLEQEKLFSLKNFCIILI